MVLLRGDHNEPHHRSLEGVELACRLATPEVALTALVHRVQKMFTPTDGVKKSFRPEEQRFVDKHKQREAEEKAKAEIDVIDVSTSLELVSKVKTLLRRCARGVTKNKQGSPDALVEFAVETLRDNGDSRDKFLQAFEVKQAGLKVRLTDSSRVEDVAKEREKRKELWVVLDQPTRRDRGFEKREVTSQKRQFGSARTKRVQESKRRIVVPSAAAKVTLQSMDCIDELVMSIAWALVGQMEKDKNPESMAAVADLAEPLIRVIEGEASDSVATLALLVLHELLKATYVTVQPETVAKLGETVFDVVERTGEIRSACFRLLAVLLLHRELALRPELAIVCCSLVRTDLDKKNTFVIPALHLLKAIVVRKIEVPEVYDLMPIVQEKVLHHSASAVVSQLAASVIARFITDWKMTPRKLDSHLDFIIRNLGYPVAAGRLALLGLLRIVFQRFPEELLKKDIEYFFVPLAHRLMADDERPVRRLAALALAALFKLAGSSLSKVVSILDAWLHGDAALQITALQVGCQDPGRKTGAEDADDGDSDEDEDDSDEAEGEAPARAALPANRKPVWRTPPPPTASEAASSFNWLRDPWLFYGTAHPGDVPGTGREEIEDTLVQEVIDDEIRALIKRKLDQRAVQAVERKAQWANYPSDIREMVEDVDKEVDRQRKETKKTQASRGSGKGAPPGRPLKEIAHIPGAKVQPALLNIIDAAYADSTWQNIGYTHAKWRRYVRKVDLLDATVADQVLSWVGWMQADGLKASSILTEIGNLTAALKLQGTIFAIAWLTCSRIGDVRRTPASDVTLKGELMELSWRQRKDWRNIGVVTTVRTGPWREFVERYLRLLGPTDTLGGRLDDSEALNVLLKETEAESRAYVDRFFPEILLDLTTPASIDKAPTSAGKRKKVRFDKENWEVPYHATIALESVIAQHSDKVGDHLSVIWNNLLGNLLHRCAIARIRPEFGV
ncbi:U3 small nucleolar RNA-associated protein 20 [Diplonema papillatum]|nr:U3 small nucleolar RNA-associated protein 20 [Diplonema papillatum]